jgi:signal transduction histidine kinase
MSQTLSTSKTNFCYQILALDGEQVTDKVLGGNMEEGEELEGAVETVYYAEILKYADEQNKNRYYSGYWTSDNINNFTNYFYYDSESKAYILSDIYDDYGDDGEGSPEVLAAIIKWGFAKGFPVEDKFQQLDNQITGFQRAAPFLGALCVVALVGSLAAFIFLMYSVGHKEGFSGIYLSVVHKCPVDLLTCLILAVLLCGGYVWFSVGEWGGYQFSRVALLGGLWIGIGVAVAMAVVLFYITSIVAQIKAHRFWRGLLVTRIVRGIVHLLRNIRLFWRATAVYCLLGLVALWCVRTYLWYYETIFIVIIAVIGVGGLALMLWWLSGWEKAKTAAEKLAQGDLQYQTDPSGLPWDLQRHIENLNHISGGMQAAVQEQMKSEHFRTELITNVSHDLKTPLTSIINYVDLLKKLDIQDPVEREYIDVLDRKSQRLKTLTEDLVEASKAATGVLTVNLQKLEAGQLLQQALGEYQERLDGAELIIVSQIPKEPVYIQADGRHLWRILDNLLSNCAKYAMPRTRVYATVEEKQDCVSISVKNISAEPLNVPPEELVERFVRGDSSRTNEGSGLGLSIAQSLAQIQGAELRISVDGDLFKAEICFPKINQSYPI